MPCWLPFFTVLLVNLHLNWPLFLWVLLSVLAACQKEPEATEEVQISSNGLDPDGCAHDNSPLCLWFGFLSVRNTEATTITQQNYACRTSPIDVLKSAASCYDN